MALITLSKLFRWACVRSGLLWLLVMLQPAGGQLKIDFSPTGGLVETGFAGYFATHEVPSTFTAQSYSAFGGVVRIKPSWPPGAISANMQMINRSSTDGSDAPNLLRDWIGTDNRSANGGDQPMTLTISGLPAGYYSWLSWHHDTQDQTGPFDVTITDGAGSTTTTAVDITDGNSGSSLLADVAVFTANLTSNGSDDIIMVFDGQTRETSTSFFVMNGFVLESLSPCSNTPPQISGGDTLVVSAGKPVKIELAVTDDGRPYQEGCNPANPDSGTSYPLIYRWTQLSGPAPVTFDPLAADTKDIQTVFPLPGTYELILEATDGPVGPRLEDGKTAQFKVTVAARQWLAGDLDNNGSVDINDLQLFTAQWLQMVACVQNAFCADLNDSDSVTSDDFALLAGNWMVETSQVVIDEFVASNRLSLPDGDGNSSDWIELYNPQEEAVSLAGWYLTDDKDNLKKWPFPPQAIIKGGDYLIVFASGQTVDNYVDAKGYLHTNFALEKDGDYLALVSPAGRIQHEYTPEYPPQETDISYGMYYTLYRYFSLPTPGQANQQAFLGYTDKTRHRVERGFYDTPFTLQIICDTPESYIRYTTDGTIPTEQNGVIYDPNQPITISTTTTIRSVALRPGWRTGEVSTHTYLFIDAVAAQPANPAGWPDNWGYEADAGAVVPADYEMDPRVVNNTLAGYSMRDALLDIPTVAITMRLEDFATNNDTNGIYSNSLDRWERQCSVEYMLPDGAKGFQDDCKIEVHGNASRRPARMQKHSLRLTFTSLYGNAKLDYLLFAGSPVETFNQLVLRAGFTDSWGLVSWDRTRYRPNDSQYIRDFWMKESFRDMGQPSSYGNYVHLYVNGLYFGIHNLSERLASEFFADHLGGQPEDWEINADFSTPGARWNTMLGIDPALPAEYARMKGYLDLENFADYMLLHFYADAEDWPHHNGYAAANAKSGDGKFRFFVWDQEIMLDYHGRAALRIDSTGGAGGLFQKLRTSEEFRLLFADRVYKHCFDGGALSMAASQERYRRTANRIDKAIVAESARWGDTRMKTPYGSTIEQPSPLTNVNHLNYPPAPHGTDYYFTREDSWLVERDNVINNYIPAIYDTANSWALINILRSENLYPACDPPVFQVNGAVRHGGTLATGEKLTLANPNAAGIIYYTLNGTDPRLEGGEANPDAFSSSGDTAIALDCSTIVKARVIVDGQWSALADAVFVVGPVRESLRVSEIMYHPQDLELEFIELKNIGMEAINLNLVCFNRGITHLFGDTVVQPGGFALLVKNGAAFAAAYPALPAGTPVMQWQDGTLENGGEGLEFLDALGRTIQLFSYKEGWYPLTDGDGFSLTCINAAQTDLTLWDQKEGWRASTQAGGSPGADDTGLAPDSVVINEALTHSDGDQPDWIELYNTTNAAITLDGWYLSDDGGNLTLYTIPANTQIKAHDYKVFNQQDHFGGAFAISENGETLYLTSGLNGQMTGYQAAQDCDAAERNVTLGRYVKSDGTMDFVAMAAATMGQANSGPQVGPLVITAMQYNPAAANTGDEFLLLRNISGAAVTLMDEVATEIAAGVFNKEWVTWRFTDGIDFVFPANTTLAAGQSLVIARNPAAFQAYYGVQLPVGMAVLGPFVNDTNLSNGGEKVRLCRPGDQPLGKARSYIRVDQINYDDELPWPVDADGKGKMLKRINPAAYGNDVINWTVADPTPVVN